MSMNALSPQDMTTYLKTVLDTESSLFRQQLVRQEAQNSLRYEEPKKRIINKPKKETFVEPEKPISYSGWVVFQRGIGMILALAAVVWMMFHLKDSGFVGFIYLGLITILLSVVVGYLWDTQHYYKPKNKRNQEAEEYQCKLLEYEQNIKRAEEKYTHACQQYEQNVAAEEQRFSLAVAAAKKRYEAACNQVRQLDSPIGETREILQQLYDTGIIFPKYQNFPAICMFYEYFASGRCSELQGPNGAYNMYESELRQNLIINKLDGILGQLDSIKQNQFVLYQEVKRTADILPELSSDISNMLDETKDISLSSAIAAQCADTAAQNAEALKYLTYIKR